MKPRSIATLCCAVLITGLWAEASSAVKPRVTAAEMGDTTTAPNEGAVCTPEVVDDSIFEAGLSYPSDCKASIMRRACTKNGCSVEEGGKHAKCKKGSTVVTLIPHTVKSNNTCRDAIKRINKHCG